MACSGCSDCVGSDFFKQGANLLRSLEHVHFVVHLVVVEDLVQVALIFVAIVQGDRDALRTKSSCSTDSVQIVLRIADSLSVWTLGLSRDIEVDHELDLGNIDASCEQISSDDDADFTGAELRNHFVTLLNAHVTEDDARLVALSAHHGVQAVCVVLRVHKNDSLGHLANVENLLNELRLLALLAPELELFDVTQVELLLIQTDLLGLLREVTDLSLNLLGVGRREEDVLDFLRQLRDVLRMDFLKLLQTSLLAEEHIRLVENDTFQRREVELLIFCSSRSEAVRKLAKSGDNDVSVSLASC